MTKHECDSGCQHTTSIDIEGDVDNARRSFLKDAVVAGGGALSRHHISFSFFWTNIRLS